MIRVIGNRSVQFWWRCAFGFIVNICILAIATAGYSQADRVGQLTSELKDANWAVRLNAAFELGQLKDPRTVEPLVAALRDADADMRRTAATALGEIKSPLAVEPLIALLKDSEAQVRYSAVAALGEIADPGAVEPLIPVLKDTEANVRQNAAEWLGRLNDPRAVEPLIAALKDTEADVQLRAARALSEIKDARATEPLMQALKGKKNSVVGGAYKFFIGQGQSGSEDELIAALNIFGNKDMALDFLNCGNPALADAGRAWAKRNNYLIVIDPSGLASGSVLWGGERMMAMADPAK
jgi:hypothetical protein